MSKEPESEVAKTEIEKGNENGDAHIQGDYNHDQIHGDSNDLTNKTSIIVNQFNKGVNCNHLAGTETKRKAFVLELDANLADILLDAAKREIFLKALENLRKIDPSLTMRDIQQGSIKITLEGSQEGLNRILQLSQTGDLKNIAGFSVIKTKELSKNENAALKSKLITNLRNPDVPICQLAYVDLRGANLKGVNLRGAILTHADLRGAYLARADLREADLSKANLRSVSLWRANLSKAYLAEADLRWANLGKSNLSEASLWMANLSGADLRKANLNRANLVKSNLTRANLRRVNVSKTIFSDNKGLSEKRRQDLSRHGAIFQDSQNLEKKSIVRVSFLHNLGSYPRRIVYWLRDLVQYLKDYSKR